MKRLKGIKKSMSLYDSKNGKTLYAYNIVDASHLCINVKQLLIKYTNAVDGKIAQLNDLYEKGVDMGTMVHYKIGKMHPIQLANDSVFEIRCLVMGCDKNTLAEFIFDNI